MYPSSTATNAAAVDSGTTDAATEGKLTESGQNFLTTVTVGDYAVITTGVAGFGIRTSAIVTAVDSNTILSVEGSALPLTGTGGLSASGTVYSIIAAADISKCVLAGADFPTAIEPGDMVCNIDTSRNYEVTAVIDATTLLINHLGGIIAGDDFFILSERAASGNRKILIDGTTLIRGNVANGEITLHYKRGATNQKLAIDPGDTVTDDDYAVKFKALVQIALQSKWTNVDIQMPIMASTGTQGVQYGDTFTFS